MWREARSLRPALIAGAVVLLSATAASAASVADFYKGRTITVYIGASAGGGYDFYGRSLARFYGKHLPGNPAVIAKNMPGAGTLRLANWLYNAGPRDGSAIGTIGRGLALQKMMGRKGVKLDGAKFNWIGSVNKEVSACALSSASPTKSFADLLKRVTVFGSTGRTSDNVVFALFVKNLTGAKIRLISGYPGTRQAVLAMERGEVEGICGWSWSSVKRQKYDWWKEGKLNVILQFALSKHPDLTNVPLITELAKNERERQMMNLLFAAQDMGRPFVAPPGVPAERVTALRRAFDATMKDPEFLAYAKRVKLEVAPITGEEVQKLVTSVLGTPKEVVAAVKAATSPKGKLQKVKLSYVTVRGKVTKTRKGNRQVYIDYKGKEVKTKISGSRTTVTVDGKKAKRKAIKVGMSCALTYLGPGSESKKVDCRS